MRSSGTDGGKHRSRRFGNSGKRVAIFALREEQFGAGICRIYNKIVYEILFVAGHCLFSNAINLKLFNVFQEYIVQHSADNVH